MNETSTPVTTSPATRVFPAFQAHDPHKVLRFLVDALGFVENVVYRDDAGHIGHAQLDWPGGGGVMFGTYKPDDEWSREPGSPGVYLVADDIDGLYSRATRAGAVVVREPADTDYGSREFAVRDPEGNLFSVGSYAGAPPVA